MPLPLRIHVSGAFYHVTLRGNHRQDIFDSLADRQLFEDITVVAPSPYPLP
jgi:putative transposase